MMVPDPRLTHWTDVESDSERPEQNRKILSSICPENP